MCAIVEINTLLASLVVYYFQLLHRKPLIILYITRTNFDTFNGYHSLQVNSRAITDDVLELLSRRLSKNDMKRLSSKLNISPQDVNTSYDQHSTDHAAVTAAKYDLLNDWLKRQNSRTEAYVLMGEALIGAGLRLISTEVLDYPDSTARP